MTTATRPDISLPALVAIFAVGFVPLLLPIPWFVAGWAYYLLLAAIVVWVAAAGFAIWASRRRWLLGATLVPLAALLLWLVIDIQKWVLFGRFMFI